MHLQYIFQYNDVNFGGTCQLLNNFESISVVTALEILTLINFNSF